MARRDGRLTIVLVGCGVWAYSCAAEVRRGATVPAARPPEPAPPVVPDDAVRGALRVSRSWPRWEPPAVSQAEALCRSIANTPAHLSAQRHVEGGGVVDFAGLGPVGVGRGARFESEGWRVWDGWSYRCFVRDFAVLVHDADLDCTARRLATAAVATRMAALRSCADDARRVSVLLDLILAPDGRVYPVEASVDRASTAVAECLARAVAGARGPSHEGPGWARVALAFVWPGPFCVVPPSTANSP